MTKKQRRDQGNGMDQPRRGRKRSGPQGKPKSATANSVSDGDKLPDSAAAQALHNGYAQLSAAEGSGPAGQAIRGILAGIRDGFVMLDKDWRYTYVNEAGAAFLKTTPDKLIGRTIWEAFPEVRRSRFYEEFTGAVEQKAFVEFEEYYEPLHRWYECRCYPIDGGLTVLFSDTTGHKLTEQALLESRLALETAITGSNAGVWRIDLDPERPGFVPDYVYLSPQLKAFIGFAADELPNSRSAWQARILPEDLVRVQESMQAHAEGRTESHQADFRIRHKDGSIRWLSSRGRLYRDEYDRPIRWAGIDWDITDRKQAQEALQKAHDELEIRVQERTAELRKAVDIGQAERQRFNDVLETLPAYLVLLTPDHHVPFANRFFRERFGAAHGKRCFEYLFNRTEPCEPCDTYKVLETNAPHRWEWTGPDGRNYDIYDFPFTDVDGSPLIMEMGIDITERKRAEAALKEANETLERRVAERTEALQEANERLQAQTEELRAQGEELQAQAEELQAQAEELQTANDDLRYSEQALQHERDFIGEILSTAGALVIVLDRQGRIVRFNLACERLTGRAFDEVQGRPFWDLFLLPEECQAVKGVFAHLLSGQFPNEHENYWVAKNGARRLIQWSNTALTDSTGAVEYVIGTGIDITERRQAEEELAYLASFPQRNPNPVLEVDLDGRVRYINPAAERLFPDVRERGLTHPWLADWKAVVRPFQEGHTDTGLRDLTVGGRTYQQAFYYLAHDRFVRIYGFEITDRKRAEQKLAKENREIALANRILRVFVEETGDDLFDKALALVLEGMASRHGVFGYVDERGHLLCPSMSKLLDECEVPGKCIDYAPEEWKGLWARAISEKRTLYTNEAPVVPKGHVAIRNNLAAPILFQGRAIGLLNLANKETDYTDADRESIEAIADRIAPVLYAWIQRELRENGRRQAEETVHQSEQRLRLALEGGGMGLWEWDLSNDSSFWDQRVYELLGVDALREAKIETFLDCVHPEDRATVKQLIQSSLTDRANFQTEFRIVRHGGEARGEILWLALLGKILRDKQGQAGRMIGVLYDISLRKQMEDQLRRLNDQLEEEVRAQTEELRDTVDRLQDEVARRVLAEGKLRKNSRLLEAFFQHTITPMAFLDKYFNFVRVNEAYAKAQGQSPEFFVRKNHFVLCPDEETRSILEQVVRTKRPYYAYGKSYAPCRDSHRGTTPWNWRVTPLLDDLGDVQFLVFNLEDVTERQKAFGALQQRAHQLQRLALELSQAEDRERRRLAEVLHDDLQQVLAAAKFHLGLLGSRLKDEVDAQAQELLAQLGEMLREAIEKSRGLSHELSPAVLYQSDLGETFEWLARQVQAKHGLTVHTEVHGQVDSQSEPIKAFLFRAAQEILFNAVKHAKVEEARLRLQRRHGQLWLTIGDQGRGFDPHGLDRAPGFGLLSIRERVELLGGRMKIHSVQGRGSVFLITIADAEESEDRGRRTEDGEQRAAPPSVFRLPSSGPGRRLRILLVDDHKTMREGLAALIKEQQDMEIVGQADDGSKAVTLACELMPDVVIMDMAMPVMPGDEATRRIKAELPQARVVALSMFEEPGVAQRMLDAGAEVYLPKTGPFENLLAAIRGH